MKRETVHPWRVTAWLLAAASPGLVQAGIDAPVLRQFGGRYAVDCANRAAPQLRVTAEALQVEQAGQRMTGHKPVSAYSHFGHSAPPKNFQVALLGEVRGGPQLVFMVYVGPAGPYILLDGDARVLAALSKTLTTPRYRRCETLAARGAAAVPTTPAPVGVPGMTVLVADPAFRQAYLRSIGAKASERWLARFEGPAPPTREQVFDAVPYVVVAICKAHDCYDHNAVFLYAVAQQRVFGLIQQQGVKMLVGGPGAALASHLEALWQNEWRQK